MKYERELIVVFQLKFEFCSDIGNEYFEGNKMENISTFYDYFSEHLPNRDEEIDMDYHWQIEDQRLAPERNQRRLKKYYEKSSVCCFRKRHYI
jgi:hypothetical protein